METVMLQFKHEGGVPSIDEAARLFNLDVSEIDADFGVIATDPENDFYTILVDAQASQRANEALAKRSGDAGEGLFANPPIDPFGPPEEQGGGAP